MEKCCVILLRSINADLLSKLNVWLLYAQVRAQMDLVIPFLLWEPYPYWELHLESHCKHFSQASIVIS